MTRTRSAAMYVFGALVFITGMGLTLLLPWLAGAQGSAAHLDEPPAGPCYATHDSGTTVFDSPDAGAIQQAVDAAPLGGIVKTAGKCVGVEQRGGITQTVYISKSLTLKGGYDYNNWEAYPDPVSNKTILDADRRGRVAVISGTIQVALDGLYITGGLADLAGLSTSGGGMWVSAELTVTNSTIFSNTSSASGGGIYIAEKQSPAFYQVSFVDNRAAAGGGYYANVGCKPSLFDVSFVDNVAISGGGIFHNADSLPSLTVVTFFSNTAYSNGGGLFDNSNTQSIMKNIIFSGNSAINGGGMFNNNNTDSVFTNVMFSGNKAKQGGGIFNNTNKTTIVNGTFSGNYASLNGAVIYNNSKDLYLYNSILWNNKVSVSPPSITTTVYNDGGSITYTYSLVEASGGSEAWAADPSYVDGLGNIDRDPEFVGPVDPAAAPTTAGDLRLKSSSPAIDAGDNFYVTVPFDLDFLPRIRDGHGDNQKIVDMGVYEYPSSLPYALYTPLIVR